MTTLIDKARAFLMNRRRAYQLTFNGVSGELVLADLAKFCRADETTFHADPRIAAMLDGRREVWLRIQEHLRLSPEELYRLRGLDK